jgi:hypothetical protein
VAGGIGFAGNVAVRSIMEPNMSKRVNRDDFAMSDAMSAIAKFGRGPVGRGRGVSGLVRAHGVEGAFGNYA